MFYLQALANVFTVVVVGGGALFASYRYFKDILRKNIEKFQQDTLSKLEDSEKEFKKRTLEDLKEFKDNILLVKINWIAYDN